MNSLETTKRFNHLLAFLPKIAQDLLNFYEKRNQIAFTEKTKSDFVTEADKKIEERIKQAILTSFPDDEVLGEESGFNQQDAPYCWIIDPIDGTLNFLRGIPYFCISIALSYQRKVAAGAVMDPLHDELFCALDGQGALLNGKPLLLDPISPFIEAPLIGMGFNYRNSQEKPYIEIVNELISKKWVYRHSGSAALSLAHVAAGRQEAYIEHHLFPWDYSAGLLLVKEAGGFIIDRALTGENLKTGYKVFACHSKLKDSLLKITGYDRLR